MAYFLYDGNKIFFDEFNKENNKHLLLLHGNTVSSMFFTPIISKLSEKYHVIIMDFLGNGKSDRLENWPDDLWYEYSKQAVALIKYLELDNVNVIGCSGGALVAINMALENPELLNGVVADSFEGLLANSEITQQIKIGRDFAKQNKEFCSMLEMMHGNDWENVFDNDTKAVINHALNVKSFCHKDLNDLEIKMLLTGSNEDEMFPKNYFNMLFKDLCNKNNLISSHIFEKGNHPSMMSNFDEFIDICDKFFL